MKRLYLAVPRRDRGRRETFLDERTAGTWRARIELVDLYSEPASKGYNDGEVERIASLMDVVVFAPRAHTSTWLEETFPNVQRFAAAEFDRRLVEWLNANRLSWRANVDACMKLGAFRWSKYSDWCEQFRRVDPVRGLRVAAGILVQLRIATVNEMAGWFDDLPEVDYSSFFIGSDPHSGDYSLVNVLSARISGKKLADAHELPAMKAADRFRIFSDGGWSGGESERRLKCLYLACDKKTNCVPSEVSVSMRFAYITDGAETRINDSIAKLRADGTIKGQVHLSYPAQNRLVLGTGADRGLAFQDGNILRFVDPNDPSAMKKICQSIGQQLSPRRPLGTAEIASTIAFEHSLPKAMLPHLIFGGKDVVAEDGSTFEWQPLLQSKHVSDPAADDQAGFYCATCPFVVKTAAPGALPAKKPA